MSEQAPDQTSNPGLRHGGLRSSRKPRYLQVADELREELKRGDHPVGGMLPTEAQLCERFAISRYTAREALRILEEMGLVTRRRGSGTQVRSAEPHVRYNQYVRSIDDLLQYTQATRFQLRHSDRLEADATIASWLDARAGTECVLLHGIRYQRRMLKPFCITDVYRRATMQGLPPGYARVEDAMRALIEGELFARVGLVEQRISAVSLDAEQARELEVEPGSPALRSLRRYFDPKDRILLVAVTLHPGDVFHYMTRYERSDVIRGV
ncbi:MAG: GntR family transcriptional regulator [Tahibacter sp.]